jgi:hypothetical protein
MKKSEILTESEMDIFLRTSKLLHDFDEGTGKFSGRRNEVFRKILDLDFIENLQMNRDEVKKILEDERMLLITGICDDEAHVEKYGYVRDSAKKWREENGYLPTMLGPFKFTNSNLKNIQRRMKERLNPIAIGDIYISKESGLFTFNFKFRSNHFSAMRGRMELKYKYNGNTYFSIVGGSIANGNIFINLTENHISGVINSARFGFGIPDEFKYLIDDDIDLVKTDSVLDLFLAAQSYYQV